MTHAEVLLNCVSGLNPSILCRKESETGVELSKVKIGLAKLGQVLHEFVIC